MQDAAEEQEYVLSRIIEHRFVNTGRGKNKKPELQFLVEWAAMFADEWISASGLLGTANEAVQSFVLGDAHRLPEQEQLKLVEGLTAIGFQLQLKPYNPEDPVHISGELSLSLPGPDDAASAPIPPSMTTVSPLIGYVNVGNSCWLSAALVMLSSSPLWRKNFLVAPTGVQNDLLDLFTAVQDAALLTAEASVGEQKRVLKHLVEILFQHFPHRDGAVRQMADAAEAITRVLEVTTAFYSDVYDVFHSRMLHTTTRVCQHLSEAETHPAIFELNGWCSGLTVQENLDLWLANAPRPDDLICPHAGCTTKGGTISHAVQHTAQFLFLSFPRSPSQYTSALVRSPSIVLKQGSSVVKYRLISEIWFDNETQHYVTVADVKNGLALFNDSVVQPFSSEVDKNWSSHFKIRVALFEQSELNSLFPQHDPYLIPAPREMGAVNPAQLNNGTLSTSLSELGSLNDVDLDRVATLFFKHDSILQRLYIPANINDVDLVNVIRAAASVEELRKAVQTSLDTTLSVELLKERFTLCLEFRDEYLRFRGKDIIALLPPSVLPLIALTFAFVLSGVTASLQAGDSEALTISLATVQLFPMVFWRPPGSEMMPDLEFARTVALRCVSFTSDGPKSLIAALKIVMRIGPSPKQAYPSGDRPSGESITAEQVERLIKHGDLHSAVARMLTQTSGFVPLTPEAERVIRDRMEPDKAGVEAISRQRFIKALVERNAKVFVPTLTEVEAIFSAKSNFKKHKAAGPSGLSNLHFFKMLQVSETRSDLLKGLQSLLAAVHSPLLTDDACQALYLANGSILKHKSGDLKRLKVVSVIESFTRLSQKFVQKQGLKHQLFSGVFKGVQNASLKNGVLVGPALFQAEIAKEASKDQPNHRLAVVSCDIKSFYTSFNRSTAARHLFDLACDSQKPEIFLGLLFEFGNHLLNGKTRFSDSFEVESQNGLIIGGASSTPYSCLLVAPLMREFLRTAPDIHRFYAYADNNNGLLNDYDSAERFVDQINAKLESVGLNCPDDSFTLHLPLFRGSDEAKREIVRKFARFKVSFGDAANHVENTDALGVDLRVETYTDPAGVILEGIPLGTVDYCKQRVGSLLSKALDGIQQVVRFPGLALSSKFRIISHSILASLNFLLSAVSPTISQPLVEKFHVELRAALDTLLGAKLSDAQFQQICLPIKGYGGFGIRSPLHYLFPAFISLQLFLSKKHAILNPELTSAIFNYNARVAVQDQISVISAQSVLDLAKLTQKGLTGKVYDQCLSNLALQLSPADQHRLQQAAMPSSGLWIAPSYADFLHETNNVRQKLTDQEYRILFGLRLVQDGGSPAFTFAACSEDVWMEGVRCKNVSKTGHACSALLDPAFIHTSSCCKMWKYVLHNVATDAIAEVATFAGIATSKYNLQVGATAKRVDIAFTSERPKLLIDVTVRSPYTEKAAAPVRRVDPQGRQFFNTSHHLNRAQVLKFNKYARLVADQKNAFRTFAFSSSGHFGSEADAIIGVIAEGMSKRFFMSHSEAVKSVKLYIQTSIFQRMTYQVNSAIGEVCKASMAQISASSS